MSCPGLIEAMRSDYPPHVRLVWLCLENHAHGVTRRWDMTDKAISAEMHLSTDSVSRAVAILERDGILQVTRRQWQASTFQMLRTYDKPAPLPADREPVTAPLPADSGAPTAPLPADSAAPLPADSVTHQVSNPPRKKETHQETQTPESGSARDVVIAEPSVARKVLDTWNGVAEEAGLQPEPVNDLRELQVARWLQAVPLDDVLAALAKVRVTPFLRGEINDWKVTLQWLMKPGHVHRVLTTSYKQNEPRKPAYLQKQADYMATLGDLNDHWARMRAERQAREGVPA